MPRVLPADVSVELDWGAWPVPPIFRSAAGAGADRRRRDAARVQHGPGLVFVGSPASTRGARARRRSRSAASSPRQSSASCSASLRRCCASACWSRARQQPAGAARRRRAPDFPRRSCWSAAIAATRRPSARAEAAGRAGVPRRSRRQCPTPRRGRRCCSERCDRQRGRPGRPGRLRRDPGPEPSWRPTRAACSTPIRRCCPRSAARCTRWRRRSQHGVKVTGCTVHLVTDDLDSGPILLQQCVEVRDDDDVDSLHARIREPGTPAAAAGGARFCRGPRAASRATSTRDSDRDR